MPTQDHHPKVFIVLIFVVLFAAFWAVCASVPIVAAAGPISSKPDVVPMVGPVSMDQDLRTLPVIPQTGNCPPRLSRHPLSSSPATGSDAAIAEPVGPSKPGLVWPAMPSPTLTFGGITAATSGCGCLPPDTDGDVGPNHYIQAVNSSFQIFNKSGGTLAGPTTYNSLFSAMGAGTPCGNNQNGGDGIVFWDHLADRWVITDFAYPAFPGTSFYQCIAVSKTSDPVAGGWWLYALQVDPANPSYMGDYPKMVLWHDAYYLSVNLFSNSTTFNGVRVFALDRNKMINGIGAPTPSSVAFTITPATLGDAYSLLPATFRYGMPDANTPEYFLAVNSSATAGTIETQVFAWRFHVDWTTPANSTFGVGANHTPDGTITVNGFVDAFTSASGTNIVPQAGTAQLLDTLGDKLMYPVVYQKLNGVESLYASQTVNNNQGGTGPTGIRWYQFTITGDVIPATPAQQQTFTNNSDGLWRWMPSLAVDASGNLAIGYSVSSSSMNPAIRYAGRLATDAASSLAQGETALIQGAGHQTSSSGRWGDYSATSLDPADWCTFWHTNEYYSATSTANWNTHIGAFRFPDCSATPDFSLTAAPTTVNACAGDDATYSVTLDALRGFNSAVTLGATGLPAGATAFFAPNPATPPGSSTLTVGNTAGAVAGTYNITVAGTSGALNHTANVSLNLATGLPAGAAPVGPVDGSTGVTVTPTFTWNAVAGATGYDVQVATDPAFANIVASATGLISATFTPASALGYDTVYYWRVNTVNGCGSTLSAIAAFRTAGSAVCVDVVGNGGFESGRNVSWSESSSQNRNIVVNTTGARTGSWYARLGGANSEDAQLWQAPAISASATTATLTYWYQILSTDLCSYDLGFLKIGGITQTTYDLCSTTNMSAYAQATQDITSLKGTSPEIRFQATTDTTLVSTLRIDDVALNVCTNSASTVADYSDLPASYGVAWHTGNGALRLGSAWDADSSFAANADDARDDDGVSFPVPLVAGATGTMRLDVQGTPANGRWVRAWIDWNNDGTFGAGELAYDGAVTDGINDLSLAIPAAIGDTVRYRVRLYDSGGAPDAGAWGGTAGGEVEDGLVPCVAAAAVSGMTISDLGNDQVQLAWTAPAGATSYQVWRALNEPYFTPGADCSSPGIYTCAATTATSYPDTAAADNPAYVVRAVSSCGGYTDAAYQRVGRFRFSLVPGQ